MIKYSYKRVHDICYLFYKAEQKHDMLEVETLINDQIAKLYNSHRTLIGNYLTKNGERQIYDMEWSKNDKKLSCRIDKCPVTNDWVVHTGKIWTGNKYQKYSRTNKLHEFIYLNCNPEAIEIIEKITLQLL
jgi:hypothetical protein